jgi:hypothetical protein
MRVLRRIAPALCALALLVLAIAPASAQQSTLGADGWLYTASVGTYGSFFPRGTAYTADSTVLVLDVLKPDGTRTRLLAPGGDTVAPDAVPFVLWEDTSRRLFLVWEGRSHIHSNVRLVSFDGSTWSEPVQISGNPFTKKSSPRLAITRETYLRDVAGKSVSGVRTTLHIVWYEDDYGDVHILYAPLALENGAPPQLLPPIFDLGDFVPAATTTGAAPSAALLRSPRVVVAADQKAVLIGLADDATHQLVTLRVDVLPVELSAVADDLEKFFDQEQNDPCTEDPTTLAERARAHLVVIGRRTLHEVIVAPTEAPTYLLTFDSAAGGLHYDLSLSVEHTVASPPAIAAGAARIHLGGNGSQTLVSWLINRTLYYQEHDGAAWLPRQSLAINDSFTLEQAYSLLDGKAR